MIRSADLQVSTCRTKVRRYLRVARLIVRRSGVRVRRGGSRTAPTSVHVLCAGSAGFSPSGRWPGRAPFPGAAASPRSRPPERGRRRARSRLSAPAPASLPRTPLPPPRSDRPAGPPVPCNRASSPAPSPKASFTNLSSLGWSSSRPRRAHTWKTSSSRPICRGRHPNCPS